MRKKRCAITFAITEDHTFALANVLIGLKKHSSVFWDDIIVFHDGLPSWSMDVLQLILPCSFQEFGHKNECEAIEKAIPDNRYSMATMYRYECFNLLKKYSKVIWCDDDIIIQDDISGLLSYGDETGYACTLSHEFTPIEANFDRPIPGYQMWAPIRNAGQLVLSDKLLQYGDLTKWCIDKSIEYAGILRMPDQGILNLMLQDFGIGFEEIDIFKYHCFPSWEPYITSEAAILHAYSPKKFWNDENLSQRYPEWEVNYHEYVQKLGQIQFKGPVVSVLMTVYNRTDFLREAVESILSQTFANFEFVIIVEKSDRQQEINEFLQGFNDSRIVIVNNDTKLGFPASLNRGLDLCKGKYIARMDDDDIAFRFKLQKQVKYMESHPEIGICGTYVHAFGKEEHIWDSYPTEHEEIKARLLFYNVMWHPTVLMRTDVLRKQKLYYDVNAFCEDYDMWVRVASCTKLANLPEVLLHYRLSGENATWRNVMKVHLSCIDILRYQLNHYLKLEVTDDELHLLNGRIDLLQYTYVHSKDAAANIRKNAKNNILRANEQTGYYDKHLLCNVLGLGTAQSLDAPAPVQQEQVQKQGRVKAFAKRVYAKLTAPLQRQIEHSLEELRREVTDNTYWNRIELDTSLRRVISDTMRDDNA